MLQHQHQRGCVLRTSHNRHHTARVPQALQRPTGLPLHRQPAARSSTIIPHSSPGMSAARRRIATTTLRGPTAAGAAADTAVAPAAGAAQNTQYTDVLVVGGGPAGLAAAIMFASHGRRVTVAERNAQVTYSDPDRSYVYAIDGRGRQWTDRYGLTGKLADAAVDALTVSVTRVQPSGKAVSSRQVIKDEKRLVYWLPRSRFMQLLEDEASSGPHAPRITLLRSTEATSITRAIDGALSVTLQQRGAQDDGAAAAASTSSTSSSGGGVTTVAPKLLIGCDGMASVVRGTLRQWAATDSVFPASTPAHSGSEGKKFSMEAAPSLSTDLRFKVLQLPPNPAMVDGTVLDNPSFCLLAGQKAAIGGAPLRLGLLPIRDATAGRTANLITLPDHPVWQVSDAEGMYAVFEQAFPQANWRQLVPHHVMEKFAASRGGQFPAPQYSNGLAMALGPARPQAAGQGGGSDAIRGSGVVLIGDAAHCFPPDLGQGVNSALEDVCVLEHEVFERAGGDLSQALPEFEETRLPDSAALIKLVQIGFPLQYNQYPKLRVLWNIRFLAQVVVHKVLPFLVSPPLFLMIQDPAQSYSSILRATQRSRNVLYVLAAALAAGVAWLLRGLLARAAGVAAA